MSSLDSSLFHALSIREWLECHHDWSILAQLPSRSAVSDVRRTSASWCWLSSMDSRQLGRRQIGSGSDPCAEDRSLDPQRPRRQDQRRDRTPSHAIVQRVHPAIKQLDRQEPTGCHIHNDGRSFRRRERILGETRITDQIQSPLKTSVAPPVMKTWPVASSQRNRRSPPSK